MISGLIVVAANLLVGVLVGLTGVAGFLLPIVYTGPLGMEVTNGLALSFAAFIASGLIGSINYKKAGNLDIPFGLRLSTGSFAGAMLGVKLNLIIPESMAKLFLYMVVLLSGISILLRKDKTPNSLEKRDFVISEHLFFTLLLGFVTGFICSLSGAGGPVLVMPLLVILGINIRTAVGVALFNSVFIGIPACVGYMMQCSVIDILPLMVLVFIIHGLGAVVGSKNAARINQTVLKRGIAIFSIIFAAWRLLSLFKA